MTHRAFYKSWYPQRLLQVLRGEAQRAGCLKVPQGTLMPSSRQEPLAWRESWRSLQRRLPTCATWTRSVGTTGSLSEMQVPGPHPRPTESETLGTGGQGPETCFSKPSRWFWCPWCLRTSGLQHTIRKMWKYSKVRILSTGGKKLIFLPQE